MSCENLFTCVSPRSLAHRDDFNTASIGFFFQSNQKQENPPRRMFWLLPHRHRRGYRDCLVLVTDRKDIDRRDLRVRLAAEIFAHTLHPITLRLPLPDLSLHFSKIFDKRW